MSAVSSEHRQAVAPRSRPQVYDRAAVVQRGARAGVVAALALLAWLGFCGEVAAAPTFVPGITSSAWTAVTAISGLLYGVGAVHGSFHVGSIAFAIGVVLVAGAVLGAVGALWSAETVGPAAGPLGAVLACVMYAGLLQVALVNVLVNALQDPDVLYHAIPPWGWIVGAATYGSVLGLRLARLGRRWSERAS